MTKIVCKKRNRATNSPFNTTLVGSMSRHPLHIGIYGTFASNEVREDTGRNVLPFEQDYSIHTMSQPRADIGSQLFV